MADALTVLARHHEPLDALIWRTLGRTDGALEPVLAANPGLASAALSLEEGRAVLIPAEAAAAPVKPLVNLWD